MMEDASAIADRRPATTTTQSEGIRLLDRLARMFATPDSAAPRASGEHVLFTWGPLEVRRLLGAGTFGEVYEAWDPTLQRDVALKLRSPETGALRWLDEARNLARVRHPHVLTVHGADVLDGRAGIWTERIIGRTLEEELNASGPFAPSEALRIGRDIASALAAVHAAGLIHGDVKTSNIMLEDGDAPRRAVLVDFGSADHVPDADDLPAYAMGTPLTMAPEVLDGKNASPAADVYGLGATLFRMLTGRYPVEAASIDELRRAHRSNQSAHVREFAPQTSARLARAVERAVEPDVAARWPDATSFARALDDIADPTRRIRARAAAIGASAAALAAVSIIVVLSLRATGPISRSKLSTPRDKNAFHEAWRQAGLEVSANFAWVVAVIDLDHDGFDDVVATEAGWRGSDGTTHGRIVGFHGSADAQATTRKVLFEGDEPNAYIGYQLANAGDTNGDGFDELLISQEPTETGELKARVRLFELDPSGGMLVPRWTHEGATRVAGIGRGMTSAGDVNGDGFDDVLISEFNAPGLARDEGCVRLFMGSKTGLSAEPAWMNRGGMEHAWMTSFLRKLGDVNGDGFDDVIVAANAWDSPTMGECGQARIFMGSKTGPGPTPVLTVEGANVNSFLGTTVGGAGDVNGDGYADALICEPRYSEERHPERGRLLLYLGGPGGLSTTPDWQKVGPVAYAWYGYSTWALDDVDGDGFDDFAVSSLQYSEGKRTHLGMIEVFRGGRDGCESKPLWRLVGDANDGHFGHVVTGGDLNGDGVTDIVVGAPSWSGTFADQGLVAAYLYGSR